MKRFFVLSSMIFASFFLASTVNASPNEIKSLKRSVKKINAALRDLSDQLRITELRLNQTPKQGEKGNQGDKGDKGDTGLVGPKGEQGMVGDSGPIGEQGPKGETGIGLLDVVPSGAKITGVIGIRGKTEGAATIGSVGEIPAKLGREIRDENIFVVITPEFRDSCLRDYPNSNTLCLSEDMFAKAIIGTTGARCEGDYHNMNPAPGALCIYPEQVYNVEKLHVRQSPLTGETTGIDLFFAANSVEKNQETGMHHAFVAHWAYLAD